MKHLLLCAVFIVTWNEYILKDNCDPMRTITTLTTNPPRIIEQAGRAEMAEEDNKLILELSDALSRCNWELSPGSNREQIKINNDLLKRVAQRDGGAKK